MLQTELSILSEEKLQALSDKVIFIEKDGDIDLTVEMEHFADRMCKVNNKAIFSKERVVFLRLAKMLGWENRDNEDQWRLLLARTKLLLKRKAQTVNYFDGILVINVNGIETLKKVMFSDFIDFVEESKKHCMVVLTCMEDNEETSCLEEIKQRCQSQLPIYEISLSAAGHEDLLEKLWREFPDLKQRLSKTGKKVLVDYVNSIDSQNTKIDEFQYLLNTLSQCQVIQDKNELRNKVVEIVKDNRAYCKKEKKVSFGFTM